MYMYLEKIDKNWLFVNQTLTVSGNDVVYNEQSRTIIY